MTSRANALSSFVLLSTLGASLTHCDRPKPPDPSAAAPTTSASALAPSPSGSSASSAATPAASAALAAGADAYPSSVTEYWETFLKSLPGSKGLSTLLPPEQRKDGENYYLLARAPFPQDAASEYPKIAVGSTAYVVRLIYVGNHAGQSSTWFGERDDVTRLGGTLPSFGEKSSRHVAIKQLQSRSDNTLILLEGDGGVMGALYYTSRADIGIFDLPYGKDIAPDKPVPEKLLVVSDGPKGSSLYAFASGALRRVHRLQDSPKVNASCTSSTQAATETDRCDWMAPPFEARGKDQSTLELLEYLVPAGTNGLCAKPEANGTKCTFEEVAFTYDASKQAFVRKPAGSTLVVRPLRRMKSKPKK